MAECQLLTGTAGNPSIGRDPPPSNDPAYVRYALIKADRSSRSFLDPFLDRLITRVEYIREAFVNQSIPDHADDLKRFLLASDVVKFDAMCDRHPEELHQMIREAEAIARSKDAEESEQRRAPEELRAQVEIIHVNDRKDEPRVMSPPPQVVELVQNHSLDHNTTQEVARSSPLDFRMGVLIALIGLISLALGTMFMKNPDIPSFVHYWSYINGAAFVLIWGIGALHKKSTSNLRLFATFISLVVGGLFFYFNVFKTPSLMFVSSVFPLFGGALLATEGMATQRKNQKWYHEKAKLYMLLSCIMVIALLSTIANHEWHLVADKLVNNGVGAFSTLGFGASSLIEYLRNEKRANKSVIALTLATIASVVMTYFGCFALSEDYYLLPVAALAVLSTLPLYHGKCQLHSEDPTPVVEEDEPEYD